MRLAGTFAFLCVILVAKADPPAYADNQHAAAGTDGKDKLMVRREMPSGTDSTLRFDDAPVRLHYRPADGWFGDAIPFYWEDVYHVFYLKIPEKDGPVRWGHVASRDLVHWTDIQISAPWG